MKYELIESNEFYGGAKLFRIKALKDFNNVKTGDIGGFVENESNLSQEGNCWLYNESKAVGDTRVLGDARIYDKASIEGISVVKGESVVSGSSIVKDSLVAGKSSIVGTSVINKSSKVTGNSIVVNTMINESILLDACVKNSNNIVNASIVGKNSIFTVTSFGKDNSTVTFFYDDLEDLRVSINDKCGVPEWENVKEDIGVDYEDMFNKLKQLAIEYMG